MKRKILAGLCLTPLMAAAMACSNTTEPDEVSADTSTSTVVVSTTETETATETAVQTETKTAVRTATQTATVTAPVTQEPTTAPVSNVCEETYGGWSTLEDSTAINMVQSTIDNVRIGRHDCFDRIVVDVDTIEDVGFHARYVPVVRQFGSGFPVPVAGEVAIELVVDAPLRMSLYDNPPVAFTTTPNWDTLREVKSAGSFEGITKFAIGVDSKVKFGVFHHTDSDGRTHVVMDIVHPFK